MILYNQDDRDEKTNHQKIVMNKRIENWKQTWRWWHYTKIYIAFFIWFILPLTIIILTFTLYPFMTVSIPSCVMLLIFLILLATGSSNNQWRAIYQSLGTLVQVMIVVCYSLYFGFIDQMASYNQNDPSER